MSTTIDDALGTRHATLQDLAALLRGQKARKIDVIAPASAIRARNGLILLDNTAPDLTPDGVGMTTGTYRPTDVCDAGIAEKLAIPAAYLRRMREQAPALYDRNVNGWLERDDRSFMIRCLRPDDPASGGTGIARAWLSDSYKVIDNLDVLVAALDGIRQTGYPVEVEECDLTERRMRRLRAHAPDGRRGLPQRHDHHPRRQAHDPPWRTAAGRDHLGRRHHRQVPRAPDLHGPRHGHIDP